MDYLKLGNTGLDVSPIAIGAMSYGDPNRGHRGVVAVGGADEIRALEAHYTPRYDFQGISDDTPLQASMARLPQFTTTSVAWCCLRTCSPHRRARTLNCWVLPSSACADNPGERWSLAVVRTTATATTNGQQICTDDTTRSGQATAPPRHAPSTNQPSSAAKTTVTDTWTPTRALRPPAAPNDERRPDRDGDRADPGAPIGTTSRSSRSVWHEARPASRRPGPGSICAFEELAIIHAHNDVRAGAGGGGHVRRGPDRRARLDQDTCVGREVRGPCAATRRDRSRLPGSRHAALDAQLTSVLSGG
jgi:hypothetical protein